MSTASGLDGWADGGGRPFSYRFRDRFKFYVRYAWLKTCQLIFDVRSPRVRLLFSEVLYSAARLMRLDLSGRKAFRITRVQTRFGVFNIRPTLLDAICVSPAFERGDLDHCLALLRLLLRTGRQVHFVDIGADVGTYAIAIGNALSKRGLNIHAFEPASESYRLLTQNITENELTSVVLPRRLALGDAVGIADLNYNARTPGSSGMLEVSHAISSSIESVPLSRLDLELRVPPDSILVLKIDVEGAERQVLDGAARLLDRCLEMHVMVEDFVEPSIVRYLEDHGFQFRAKITPYNSWWMRRGVSRY